MSTVDTAIILAGGKSSRMGFDKQFIKLGDKLIIELIIEQLRALFKEIIIVSNMPEKYTKLGCIVVQDEYKDCGPLGGIHVGLNTSSSMYSYVIACDMPYIEVQYIEYMSSIIKNASKKPEAVAAKLGQWLEPFNAIYSKKLLPVIIDSISMNNIKISSVLKKADVYYIEEQKARSFSPDWKMFTNINTIEDLNVFFDKTL